MATIWFLAWAIRSKPLLRIPIAVLADIALGIVFACASLYMGLVGGEHALSLREILRVLISKSPDGTAFEIGPCFWAMHTAFLPTVIYLSIIIVGWVGKALLVPVGWFFKTGQKKNPMKLTIALLGVFVALFATLAFAASAAQDYAKERVPVEKQVTESPD